MVSRRPVESGQHATSLPDRTTSSQHDLGNDIKEFIQETSADVQDLEAFYSINFSRTRLQRLEEYFAQRKKDLVTRFSPFDDLSQEAKVDWTLIWTYVNRQLDGLKAFGEGLEEVQPLLADWAESLIELCEKRQKVVLVDGKDAAQVLSDAIAAIDELSVKISKGSLKLKGDRFAAFRSAQHVQELQGHLQEWYSFYEGYDPLFTWWTSRPWQDLSLKLTEYATLIREKLVGIAPGDEDAIVGQPIGEKALLSALKFSMIAYTPTELISIAEKEYAWCETQAISASREMGFGTNWRAAQEHIKKQYVPPGQQPQMVHSLSREAVAYIKQHDMLTIPPIANECWRTTMIPPSLQKISPFFLGGSTMQISYPTNTMTHSEKLMTMRGNNRPFSRSTVFHEMVPGHHLQYHYMQRFKPYRSLFQTPFWIEGWAFYFEMILWDRGFAATPEDRLGMLFWRMHRCIRIIFSIKFHLGEVTPEECIEMLVERVGHERATAEGEVRRSFNGDYGPLYQAGYMLGALQFYRLRKEVVEEGGIPEKEFHDRCLKENCMPVEMLRALMKGEKLKMGQGPKWRFYDL